VSGTVEIVAETTGTVSSVAFDVSTDDGTTWTSVAQDWEPSDGWSASWDTTSLSGNAMLRAVATDGVSTAEDRTSVTVENEIAPVQVDVAREAFSPNGDGTRDEVAIRITLAAPSTVDVRVEARDGSTVVELLPAMPLDAGTTSTAWDGTDAAGRVVDDGRYRIAADAAGAAGETMASADVVVDTRAPGFLWRGIAPEPLRRIGPLRLAFRLRDRSAPMRVRYRIEGALGATVARSRSFELDGGDATLRWNGRDHGGTTVARRSNRACTASWSRCWMRRGTS
jgi:flagellar hook assembly protein FlgD